jgi:hypothetical protein
VIRPALRSWCALAVLASLAVACGDGRGEPQDVVQEVPLEPDPQPDPEPPPATDPEAPEPPAAGAYDISLRALTAMTAGQEAAFLAARVRIEQIVTGDLPDVALNQAASPSCGNVAIRELADDLLVLVQIEPIDGVGGVLGRAGPCAIRRNGLPVVGLMQFDSADLARLEGNGQLGSVVLHEMLHVLGFGTMWANRDLLSGTGTSDPAFVGSGARAAFAAYDGGDGFSGTPVPVENTGGAGTVHAHWRESVFRSELMTGWLAAGPQPMSRTTVESLADLGYVVDGSQAEPFQVGFAALWAAEDAPEVALAGEVLVTPQLEVDADGTATPIAE